MINIVDTYLNTIEATLIQKYNGTQTFKVESLPCSDRVRSFYFRIYKNDGIHTVSVPVEANKHDLLHMNIIDVNRMISKQVNRVSQLLEESYSRHIEELQNQSKEAPSFSQGFQIKLTL